jgi:hypothetical protein
METPAKAAETWILCGMDTTQTPQISSLKTPDTSELL